MHVDPRRAARGQATSAALAANFSVVSLYHDGGAAWLLAVRDLFVPLSSLGFQAGVVNGALGASAMRGVPLIRSQGAPPGSIYTATQAALPGPVDYQFGTSNLAGGVWPHEFPFVVLEPGTSLWLAPLVVNTAMTASFLWSALYPEEVLSPSAGDSFTDPEV